MVITPKVQLCRDQSFEVAKKGILGITMMQVECEALIYTIVSTRDVASQEAQPTEWRCHMSKILEESFFHLNGRGK